MKMKFLPVLLVLFLGLAAATTSSSWKFPIQRRLERRAGGSFSKTGSSKTGGGKTNPMLSQFYDYDEDDDAGNFGTQHGIQTDQQRGQYYGNEKSEAEILHDLVGYQGTGDSDEEEEDDQRASSFDQHASVGGGDQQQQRTSGKSRKCPDDVPTYRSYSGSDDCPEPIESLEDNSGGVITGQHRVTAGQHAVITGQRGAVNGQFVGNVNQIGKQQGQGQRQEVSYLPNYVQQGQPTHVQLEPSEEGMSHVQSSQTGRPAPDNHEQKVVDTEIDNYGHLDSQTHGQQQVVDISDEDNYEQVDRYGHEDSDESFERDAIQLIGQQSQSERRTGQYNSQVQHGRDSFEDIKLDSFESDESFGQQANGGHGSWSFNSGQVNGGQQSGQVNRGHSQQSGQATFGHNTDLSGNGDFVLNFDDSYEDHFGQPKQNGQVNLLGPHVGGLGQHSGQHGQQSGQVNTGHYGQQTGQVNLGQQTGQVNLGQNGHGQQSGQHEQQSGHYGQQSGQVLLGQNGHGQQTGQHGQQTGPYGQQTGQYGQQTGHYGQQTGQYGQQTGQQSGHYNWGQQGQGNGGWWNLPVQEVPRPVTRRPVVQGPGQHGSGGQVVVPGGVKFSCKGRNEGYFADYTSSCRRFYRCAKGDPRAFEFECGTGTKFDTHSNQCDHEHNVKCVKDDYEDYYSQQNRI